MQQEPGPATQRLIEMVYEELDARKLTGLVHLAVPIGWLIGFLEEHGLDVPEPNRPDPDERWKKRGD